MGLASLETISEGMGTGGWLFIIASMIAIILGVIAIILIKGNMRPKSAGTIYIAVSIIGTIGYCRYWHHPWYFFSHSRIVSFARKPIQPI